MAVPVSAGDLIAIASLAHKVAMACINAPEDYQDLASLCLSVNVVINTLQPNDPDSVLKAQDRMVIECLVEWLKEVLEELEVALDKYSTMTGVQGWVNRVGFICSSKEWEGYRRRLTEHLGTLRLALASANIKISTMIARKLGITAEQDFGTTDIVPSTEATEAAVERTLHHLSDQTTIAYADLARHKSSILNYFKRHENPDQTPIDPAAGSPIWEEGSKQQAADCTTPNSTAAGHPKTEYPVFSKQHSRESISAPTTPCVPNRSTSGQVQHPYLIPKHYASAVPKPLLPAKVSGESYNPFSIPWFAQGGYRFFKFARTNVSDIELDPSIMRYSADDGDLCQFPLGWSVSDTWVQNDNIYLPGLFYVHNNLSCSSVVALRTTRAYCSVWPFFLGNDATDTASYSTASHDALENRLDPPAALKMFVIDTQGSPHKYFGVVSCAPAIAGLAFDLGDPVSVQLAAALIGKDGQRSEVSTDVIKQSLPEGWLWVQDEKGGRVHKYINIKERYYATTVHPSYFWRSDDPQSSRLPPNWDRRLDSWGNLFYVDHSTKQATRQDPRFNPELDRATGLPTGWRMTYDSRKKANFFYLETGSSVLGTYEPDGMRSKSVTGKCVLRRVPYAGEDIRALLTPEQLDPIQFRMEGFRIRVVPMTEAERNVYNELFFKAPKANENIITEQEALAQCGDFFLPEFQLRTILYYNQRVHNGIWSLQEYCNALHMIKSRLIQASTSELFRPKKKQDLEGYCDLFDRVYRANDRFMTRSELEGVCRRLTVEDNFSPGYISKIIDDADWNCDHRWRIAQFVDVMHRLCLGMCQRQALQKLSPQPNHGGRTAATNNITLDGVPIWQETYNTSTRETTTVHHRRSASAEPSTEPASGLWKGTYYGAQYLAPPSERPRAGETLVNGVPKNQYINQGMPSTRTARSSSCDTRLFVRHPYDID